MEDLVQYELNRFKDRERLILKLEENGFSYDVEGIFYKKIKINKFEKYVCFAMTSYITRYALLSPRFGLSEIPARDISFSNYNWSYFFNTEGNKDACKAILRTFDSIMNFFCDGKEAAIIYGSSIYMYCVNEHLKFSCRIPANKFPTITFSSSGNFFINSDTSNSKESDDLYGH